MVIEAFQSANWEGYNWRGGILGWVGAASPSTPVDWSVAEH